jgi:lipoyl-dependent peroxiredoxin
LLASINIFRLGQLRNLLRRFAAGKDYFHTERARKPESCALSLAIFPKLEKHSRMATRTGSAVWEGTLKSGKGNMKLGSGAFEGQYSFSSRFENGSGTNPEELIGAAEAGCFSMALSVGLEKAGYPPKRISTSASVQLEKVGDAFRITAIDLETDADVPGIDDAKFQEQAEQTKKNCPVSVALSGTQINLRARLASR